MWSDNLGRPLNRAACLRDGNPKVSNYPNNQGLNSTHQSLRTSSLHSIFILMLFSSISMPGVLPYIYLIVLSPVLAAIILFHRFRGKCQPCSEQVYNSSRNWLLWFGHIVWQVQLVLALSGQFGHAYIKAFLEYILVCPMVTVPLGALWGPSEATAWYFVGMSLLSLPAGQRGLLKKRSTYCKILPGVWNCILLASISISHPTCMCWLPWIGSHAVLGCQRVVSLFAVLFQVQGSAEMQRPPAAR